MSRTSPQRSYPFPPLTDLSVPSFRSYKRQEIRGFVNFIPGSVNGSKLVIFIKNERFLCKYTTTELYSFVNGEPGLNFLSLFFQDFIYIFSKLPLLHI